MIDASHSIVALETYSSEVAQNLDYDTTLNVNGRNRVGLLDNGKCGRLFIICTVSCLFNISKFCQALSKSRNEPAQKLTELFAQMQLGNERILIEESFVKYFKTDLPENNEFWSSRLIGVTK